MKLSSRGQIANLVKFKSDTFLTTSFYLNTDKSRLRKKQLALSFKNLINTSKAQVEEKNLRKTLKESLYQDLEYISQYGRNNLKSRHQPGLAVFSCSQENFWEVFDLPNPPRNRVVFDQNPYVRPLSAILNEHSRICVLTIDRKEAKWYDLFMGELTPLEHRLGDVPSKVREGGWEGYESKRIERHIATHLHDFFKESAGMTFDLFKKKSFDWLFLGCKDEYSKEFEPLLHPYLKERLKAYIKSSPSDSPTKVLKKSSAKEKELKEQEETETVNTFISELKKGGLAASGLKNTLESLNRGEVQTLLVARHYSKPGKICPQCGFLFTEEIKCPFCRRKTEPLTDVIDEAVESALEKKGHVKHIDSRSPLSKYGDIGALLRYKT